jgi:H+-translocating NAD(P) transhydrogenase subunit beta
MGTGIFDFAYFIATIFLVIGLKRLSSPKTAVNGNLMGAVGMGIGILAALFYPLDGAPNNYIWIIVGLIAGTIIGWVSALRVKMTGMPQMVSIFNGLGGASAMILGIIEFLRPDTRNTDWLNQTNVLFTIFVGAVAFSGSILAWLKLDGIVNDKKLKLPAHQYINIILLIASIASMVFAYYQPSTLSTLICAAVCLIYGWSFVAPIGGADMPVVIAYLNSITGISSASAGLLFGNQFMVVGGILVGASGVILTVMMCAAMNRSVGNVFFGDFSASGAASSEGSGATGGTVVQTSASDVAVILKYSTQVLMVPGYGLAVSQAQKIAKELEDAVGKDGVEVFYGIHPVAGRMPGHMNVLLAEANISYDKLLDLEEANSKMPEIDMVLVVGANDVVNPAAVEDKSSNIYGMPVLEVWKAKQCVVFKRGMATGYAGIENPLFYKPNTKMLFGDAKASLKSIIDELKGM